MASSLSTTTVTATRLGCHLSTERSEYEATVLRPVVRRRRAVRDASAEVSVDDDDHQLTDDSNLDVVTCKIVVDRSLLAVSSVQGTRL